MNRDLIYLTSLHKEANELRAEDEEHDMLDIFEECDTCGYRMEDCDCCGG